MVCPRPLAWVNYLVKYTVCVYTPHRWYYQHIALRYTNYVNLHMDIFKSTLEHICHV